MTLEVGDSVRRRGHFEEHLVLQGSRPQTVVPVEPQDGSAFEDVDAVCLFVLFPFHNFSGMVYCSHAETFYLDRLIQK